MRDAPRDTRDRIVHVADRFSQIDFLIRDTTKCDTTFFSGDDLLNPKSASIAFHVPTRNARILVGRERFQRTRKGTVESLSQYQILTGNTVITGRAEQTRPPRSSSLGLARNLARARFFLDFGVERFGSEWLGFGSD